MAILKIARMGHPVLRRIAEKVEDTSDPAVARLVADMIETLVDISGAGLAAPQVHTSLRIVMFHVPEARAVDEGGNNSDGVPFTILLNPEIEAIGSDLSSGIEACLSLPGLAGVVPRFNRIVYRGVSETGDIIEREAEGFHARVVQHECDHLDGILYPMRMTDLSTLTFTTEISRNNEDQE